MSQAAADTPSFESDIRPLFREKDREAMEGAFDLWDREDVSANAEAILASVAGGEMPCDGPWPEEQVELLRRWVEGGMPA
jgi:hypothetical protein